MTTNATSSTPPTDASTAARKSIPSIRETLLSVVWIPVLLLVLFSASLYWQVTEWRSLARWVVHTQETLTEMNQLERMLVDRESGVRGFFASKEESFLDSWRDAETRLRPALSTLLTKVSDNPEQVGRIQRVQELSVDWEQQFALPMIARTRSNLPYDLPLGLRGKSIMDETRRTIRRAIQIETALLAQRNAAAKVSNDRLQVVGGGLLLVSILLMTFFTRGRLTQVVGVYNEALALSAQRQRDLEESEIALKTVIEHYSQFIQRLANGELSATVTPSGEGELLRFGQTLNTMGNALRSMTLQVNETSTAMIAASTQILSVARQQSASVAETASAVTQTATSVDELTQSAHHTADRAASVSATSRKSEEIGRSGRAAVERSTRAIDTLRENMGAISSRIFALSEQVQTVGQIVTSVNELAEQSNMLALNAAIEAARAGEHGRGFAVVAQEVRSLTEQSKRATAQIRGILQEIQRSTAAAVLTAEEGAKAVDKATGTVQDAGQDIERLVDALSKTFSSAEQITTATQQQVTGIGQIAQAMRSIDQAASRALDGAKQADAAAKNLNELGTKLREAVLRYRV